MRSHLLKSPLSPPVARHLCCWTGFRATQRVEGTRGRREADIRYKMRPGTAAALMVYADGLLRWLWIEPEGYRGM